MARGTAVRGRVWLPRPAWRSSGRSEHRVGGGPGRVRQGPPRPDGRRRTPDGLHVDGGAAGPAGGGARLRPRRDDVGGGGDRAGGGAPVAELGEALRRDGVPRRERPARARRPGPRERRGVPRPRGVRQGLLGGGVPHLRVGGRPRPGRRALRRRRPEAPGGPRRVPRRADRGGGDVRARRGDRPYRPAHAGRGAGGTASSSTAPSAGARAAGTPTPTSSTAACRTRRGPGASGRSTSRRGRRA